MFLVVDELPPEGNEVQIFGVGLGSTHGYRFGPLISIIWREAVDGPDPITLGVVVSWEPNLGFGAVVV